MHAYERVCRGVNLTCGAANGTVYVTIGDGGNREGLADKWVEPQPSWSAFRSAAFGHGELWAANRTHLRWEWVPNAGLGKAGDRVWVVKGGGRWRFNLRVFGLLFFMLDARWTPIR